MISDMGRGMMKMIAMTCNQFKKKNAFFKENAIPILDLEKYTLSILPKKSFSIVNIDRIFLDPLKIKKYALNMLYISYIIVLLFSILIFSLFLKYNYNSIIDDFEYYIVGFIGIFIFSWLCYFVSYQPFKKFFFKKICVNEDGECTYRENGVCLENEFKLAPLLFNKK